MLTVYIALFVVLVIAYIAIFKPVFNGKFIGGLLFIAIIAFFLICAAY